LSAVKKVSNRHNNLVSHKVQKEQKCFAVKVANMHMLSVLWLLVKWCIFWQC